MKKYDVLVVGGGTSGVACAYTASKLGLKVLIVESNSYLGGSITSSLVIPAMKTSENSINNDFFDNLYFELKKINGAITYSDGNKGWFNPELTKIVLDKMMKDVHADIIFESNVQNIDKNLSSYTVTIYSNNLSDDNKNLLEHIETNIIVDATGDAKICQKLNCDFLDNFESKTQPINLRFIMSGIDTKTFAAWLMDYDADRNVSTSCTVNGFTYCSTACTWDSNVKWALKPLFDNSFRLPEPLILWHLTPQGY